MDLNSIFGFLGGGLWAVIFFIIALSVIVAIHEYGHYIVGKKSGIYPEVFSLGFGPVLWSRYDNFGTKWQVAAIPFGGYVKFRGDANASGGIDGEAMHDMDEAAMRSTMHGAPLWARTATVAAGPIFNFALSVVIFFTVFMWQGVVSDPLTVGKVQALPFDPVLKSGDVVLEINGEKAPSVEEAAAYRSFINNLPDTPELDYKVLRDGNELTLQGPPMIPVIVGQVIPRSASADAGMRKGDVITSANGQEIFAFNQLVTIVEAAKGSEVALTVWRDGNQFETVMTPRRQDEPQRDGGFKEVYRIGLGSSLLFEPATKPAGFVDALWGGVLNVWSIIKASLSALWHIATGQISTCNLSGPIGIAEASGDTASQGFWDFVAFVGLLSTAVGLINLFPIPVLDGGHLCFYAYEAVTGRQPSEGALEWLMKIGVIVVLSVMLLGIFSDLFC